MEILVTSRSPQDSTVGVIFGIMVAMASAQQFVAGIWAPLHGITDVVGAFRVRSSGRVR